MCVFFIENDDNAREFLMDLWGKDEYPFEGKISEIFFSLDGIAL